MSVRTQCGVVGKAAKAFCRVCFFLVLIIAPDDVFADYACWNSSDKCKFGSMIGASSNGFIFQIGCNGQKVIIPWADGNHFSRTPKCYKEPVGLQITAGLATGGGPSWNDCSPYEAGSGWHVGTDPSDAEVGIYALNVSFSGNHAFVTVSDGTEIVGPIANIVHLSAGAHICVGWPYKEISWPRGFHSAN